MDGVARLTLDEESSDEEDSGKKTLTLAERQAQAAKDREEKQRKYEERRQELFGSAGTATSAAKASNGNSGSSTPRTTTPTPPGSRSATPNRGRGRGPKRGGATTLAKDTQTKREKELFDPAYTPKPDSVYLQRREKGAVEGKDSEIQPIRAPKGPDGSGRGGFGFVARGGKTALPESTLEST